MTVVSVCIKYYATHPSPNRNFCCLIQGRMPAFVFLEGKAKINSVVMILTSGLNIVREHPTRAATSCGPRFFTCFASFLRMGSILDQSMCVICDGHSGTGAGVSPRTSLPHPPGSTSPQMLHTHILFIYHKLHNLNKTVSRPSLSCDVMGQIRS